MSTQTEFIANATQASSSQSDSDKDIKKETDLYAIITRNIETQAAQFAVFAKQEQIVRNRVYHQVKNSYLFIPEKWKYDAHRSLYTAGEVAIRELCSLRELPISGASVPHTLNQILDKLSYAEVQNLVKQKRYNLAIDFFKNKFYQDMYILPKIIDKLKHGSWVLGVSSTAITAYQIWMSDDKVAETVHQATLLAGAFTTGITTAMVAAPYCSILGVYAPACVAGAAVVGGILGTEAVELLHQVGKATLAANNFSSTPRYTPSINDPHLFCDSDLLCGNPRQRKDAQELYPKDESNLSTSERDALARKRCEDKVKSEWKKVDEYLNQEQVKRSMQELEDEMAAKWPQLEKEMNRIDEELDAGRGSFSRAHAAPLPLNQQANSTQKISTPERRKEVEPSIINPATNLASNKPVKTGETEADRMSAHAAEMARLPTQTSKLSPQKHLEKFMSAVVNNKDADLKRKLEMEQAAQARAEMDALGVNTIEELKKRREQLTFQSQAQNPITDDILADRNKKCETYARAFTDPDTTEFENAKSKCKDHMMFHREEVPEPPITNIRRSNEHLPGDALPRHLRDYINAEERKNKRKNEEMKKSAENKQKEERQDPEIETPTEESSGFIFGKAHAAPLPTNQHTHNSRKDSPAERKNEADAREAESTSSKSSKPSDSSIKPKNSTETEAEKKTAHAEKMAGSSKLPNGSSQPKAESTPQPKKESGNKAEKPKSAPIKEHSKETSQADSKKDRKEAKQEIDDLTKLAKDHFDKLNKLEKELKVATEIAKIQQIREKIEQERRSYINRAQAVRIAAKAAAQGLASFVSDGAPDDIKAAARFASGVEHFYNIFENYSFIHANKILSESKIDQMNTNTAASGVDTTPNLISMIASFSFLIMENATRDDNELNGFEVLLNAFNFGFEALSKQMARFEAHMIDKFNDAADDRHIKHLAVLKEFAKSGRENRDLKETLKRLHSTLSEKQEQLESSIEHVSQQVSGLHASVHSNLEGFRTEGVAKLIKKIDLAYNRGEISSPEKLHGFLDDLTSEAITGARSKFITGGDVDIDSDEEIRRALKGVASFQDSETDILCHPAFSKLNLLKKYFRKNHEKDIKLRQEALANPMVFADCSRKFVILLNDFMTRNPKYPQSVMQAENDLKMLRELQQEGRDILQIHKDIHRQKLIAKLFEKYEEAFKGLNAVADEQAKDYEGKYTQERRTSLLHRIKTEDVIEFTHNPMPKFQWFSNFAKFVRDAICFMNDMYVSTDNDFSKGSWYARTEKQWVKKFRGSDSTSEWDDFYSSMKYVFQHKEYCPPGSDKAQLWEVRKETDIKHLHECENATKQLNLKIFSPSEIPSKTISRIIFPKNKKVCNLILPEPKDGISIDSIYRTAEMMELGEIKFYYEIEGDFIIIHGYFIDGDKRQHLILSLKMNLELESHEKGIGYESISMEEKLWDRWHGGRYPKGKDIMTINNFNGVHLSKFYFPPVTPYPAIRDVFLKEAETLPVDSKKIHEAVKVNIDVALIEERRKFNKTLAHNTAMNTALEKLDAAYYMLTETLKFVYGKAALQIPLLKRDYSNNALRNGEGVKHFCSTYQGNELTESDYRTLEITSGFQYSNNEPKYLASAINTILHIALPESKKFVSSLKPEFPLVSEVTTAISGCITRYEARIAELGGMKALSEVEYSAEAHVQSMSKEMEKLTDKVSSLELALNRSNEEFKRANELMTQMRGDLNQKDGAIQEMLQLMKVFMARDPHLTANQSAPTSNTSAENSRTYLPSEGLIVATSPSSGRTLENNNPSGERQKSAV